MFFILPLLPAFAAFAVSIGEAVGIGAGLVGIGAGVKGSVDYRKAKTMRKNAHNRHQTALSLIRRKTKAVQKRFEDFGRLKLEAYTGIIKEAADRLSRFRNIDLSPFRDTQVEHISFFSHELDGLNESCVKASDVLSCLAIGVNTAANDRFPYKDAPPMTQTIGAFGLAKRPIEGLPNISYAAIAMTGLTWGISGSVAKTQARATAAQLSCETEKLESVLAGYKALLDRIEEGEHMIASLTEKLRIVLASLSLAPMPATDEAPPEMTAHIEAAISLVRALKQAIETDVCGGNGLLTVESGVAFKKSKKEYAHV
jgi:hypothetical protein